MRLYSVTITASIEDLETLDVSLSADVEVADPSLQSVALAAMPTHLRKVAGDIEEQR